MVKCTNCGRKLKSGDSICADCGQDVKGAPPASRKGKVIGLAVLFFFVAGLTAFLVISFTSKEFGDTYWGMSEEKVISLEKSKGNSKYEVTSRESDFSTIVFRNVIVKGEAADVWYSFRKNELYQGVYRFKNSDAGKMQPFIQELTKKYGEPTVFNETDYGQYLWQGFRSAVSLQYRKDQKGFEIHYDRRQND